MFLSRTVDELNLTNSVLVLLVLNSVILIPCKTAEQKVVDTYLGFRCAPLAA